MAIEDSLTMEQIHKHISRGRGYRERSNPVPGWALLMWWTSASWVTVVWDAFMSEMAEHSTSARGMN